MVRLRQLFKNSVFIYISVAFLCFILASSLNNYDYDLYARLIVGEHFFFNKCVAYQDFLSYTPTHLWYDHEWGASVIFYFFYKIFGPFGFILAQAITMFITTFYIIKTQKLQKKSYPTSFFLITIFLITFSHLNPSLIRCHMFSFMFFSIFLYILEKTRHTKSNILWLIPLLTIIWNNIHGGVVSGIGLIFLYYISAIFSKSPAKKYFIILCLSLPLLVINPYGIDYLNFLFSANTMNRKYITEWWSVFSIRHLVYYFPAFCIGLITLSISLIENKVKKFDITKFIVILTTTVLGFLHVKLLSLTIIAAFALYSNEILKLIKKNYIKLLNQITHLIVCISIILIPLSATNVAKIDFNKFPILETEFIKINKIKGNIVSSFGLGSYIAYKLYPQNLIFMDGRYEEVYYNKEFEALLNYELANPEWENIWEDYHTDILMPIKTIAAYEKLKKHPSWKLIYEGNICGVFVKKENAKNKYLTPTNNIKYYQKTAFENLGKFSETD